jgi:acyl-coenzyme A thioesterase PaaI-like protein
VNQHPIGTTPAPGTRLDGTLFGPSNRCFACGPNHPTGLRLGFHVEGEEVVTRFTPIESHQGAPGMMHGGLITTVADEVGCWALIALKGKFGFTGTMSSRFPRAVRTGQELEGRSRITGGNARIMQVDVRLLQGGVECFSSAMSFIVMDQGGAEKMLGGPLPEAWKTFFR